MAAPSSAAEPERTDAGLAALRSRGLQVEPGRAHAAPWGHLSGTDDERAAELNRLFSRDDLDAIMCVRGGYGLLRILDRLDYAAARAHPKLVVGYSDVTALHLALWSQAGLPGLSGPMVASDWPEMDDATEAQLWALAGGASPFPIVGPEGEPLAPLRDGSAEGVLLGGNLALVCALLGTPYLPDLDGAILFVEDIGEAPYRIDGMLARLRLAGVLGRLGGLVVGAFTGAEPPEGRPSFSVERVIEQYADAVGGPVATGLVYGHFPRKTPMPIGVRARLDVGGGAATLTTLDPLVSA